MNDEPEEWPYSDFGKSWKSRVDIAHILRGAGFDEFDDPFQEREPNQNNTQLNHCECDTEKLREAGESLYKFLKEKGHFPRDDYQLESFRAISGYASGKWRDWVDVERSNFVSLNNNGLILLSRRCDEKHACWITFDLNKEIHIIWRGVTNFDVGISMNELNETNYFKGTKTSTLDILTGDEFVEDSEITEEMKYDHRTFGALEPDNSHGDSITDRWLEAGFEIKDSELYIKNNLDLENIFELMKFMPEREISKWVLKFGKKSIDALELLKLSYSDEITKLEIDIEKFDKLSEELSESIRKAVQHLLRKWIRDRKAFEQRAQ